MNRIVLFLAFLLLFSNVSYSQVLFEDVTASSTITTPTSNDYSFSSIWVDVDGDDYFDLYIAHGNDHDDEYNQLYHNRKNGTFSQIPFSSFIGSTPAYTGQLCWGDFNNDGFPDLYESHFNRTDNRIWKNNGNLTFTDVSNTFTNPGQYSTGAIFTDFDLDGKLDLLVNTQSGSGSHTYHNVGLGSSFVQVTPFKNRGVGDEILETDINNDNLPDYMFGNALGLDSIYINTGSGFTGFNVNFLAAVRNTSDYPGAAAFGDVDNDGYPDLITHYPNKFYLFHNLKGTTFTDWTSELNLDSAKEGYHHSIFFCDFDNDGWLDIIILNTEIVSEIWYGSSNGFHRDNLPINTPPKGGLQNISLADYDNDGFMDILHCSIGETHLWHNKGNANQWLNVTLRGHQANSQGLGAKVISYVNGKPQYREIGYNQGNYGYYPSQAHFGFGPPDCSSLGYIDSLVVIWQPGGRQVIKNVRMNELVVVDQDSGIVRTLQKPLAGGAGYAQNFSVFNANVPADTIVQVPMKATLSSSSQLRLDSITVTELTFRVLYNSNIVDVTPSKVAQRYSPPTGWSLKNSVVGTDSIMITISNDAQQKLSKVVDLGALRFDTYFSQPYGTFVTLNSIAIRTNDGLYSFCTTTENNFLAHIIVGWSSGVASSDPKNDKLVISPDPIVGGVVQLHLPEASGKSEVLIYDALGRELLREQSEVIGGSLRCRVDALSAGTYYARVVVGSKHYVGTFRKID